MIYDITSEPIYIMFLYVGIQSSGRNGMAAGLYRAGAQLRLPGSGRSISGHLLCDWVKGARQQAAFKYNVNNTVIDYI